MNRILKFLSDKPRATVIEYILIAVGIAFATTAVVNSLGSGLNTLFGPCPC